MLCNYRIFDDNNICLGVAWLRRVEQHLYFLSFITIYKQFRGKGYGKLLLGIILKDAKKENIHIELKVDSFGKMSHNELINWYEKQGFVRIEGNLLRN